ncbi:MAG: hypothetical protein SFX72_22280 [Isosphaeraceae bacterium]|nr:hypothetical protein [Isosphaeraceae bacterium]
MDARLRRLFVVSLLPLALGAGPTHRTTNFLVEAPTAEIARKVAERAEECRSLTARSWLGRELRPWARPCPIKVKLTGGEAGGMTSFEFGETGVVDRVMSVEGSLDRLLAAAVPHEVTHTVFADFFGGPMPRWADEGASMLSEDGRELQRQERIVRVGLERGSSLALGRLFSLEEYPGDLLGFYGQGYSVARFLVEMGGRPRFLAFVKQGAGNGWDLAVRDHYGLANVKELDRAWRAWHEVRIAAQPRRTVGDATRAQSAEE